MYNKPQLFLLHFAGGSSYSFDFLKKYLTEIFEFIPIELPGRGKRQRESFIYNKEEAINDYVNQIKTKRKHNKSYIIYGHSMGSTLGLNVTKRMEKMGDPPQYLVVSGNPGPGIKELDEEGKRKGKRYLMSDKDFKEELRELGGVPEEILFNKELYDFFAPIMRADFKILETGESIEENLKVVTPIFAIMGTEEKYADKVENWKKFTLANFRSQLMEGDHFFINHHSQEIADVLMSCLSNVTLKY